MTGPCPLCGTSAEVAPAADQLIEVHCSACGGCAIWENGLSAVNALSLDEKLRLAWTASHRAEHGQRLRIGPGNLEEILASVPPRTDPFEPMDRILDFLSRKAQDAADWVDVPDSAFPRFRAKSQRELDRAKELLASLNWVDRFKGLRVDVPSDPEKKGARARNVRVDQMLLRPAGWERLRELRRIGSKSDQAFVAMWFDPSLTDAWENAFHPVLYCSGFDPIRIDREHFEGKIDDEILAKIRQSGLLVADFTGGRGGVYFEAGFAMGLGIPVVWTCRKKDFEGVHFDTNHYQFIRWESVEDLRKQLSNRIGALYLRARRELPAAKETL